MQIDASEKWHLLMAKAAQLSGFLSNTSHPGAAVDVTIAHLARMQELVTSLKADLAKADKEAA